MNEPQHTILLVEDDRAVQRALAEALHEAFAEAARLYPEEAEFHACLGWATWLSLAPGDGAAAQARPPLERALQLNPRLDRAYVFRGRIARALGKTEEAESEFEKALLCNPGCLEALHELRLGSHAKPSLRPAPGKTGNPPRA